LLLQGGVDEAAVLAVVDADGLVEERSLAAERVVEARLADAQLLAEVAHRGGLIPLAPEEADRLIEGRIAIEGPGPAACRRGSHASILYRSLQYLLASHYRAIAIQKGERHDDAYRQDRAGQRGRTRNRTCDRADFGR